MASDDDLQTALDTLGRLRTQVMNLNEQLRRELANRTAELLVSRQATEALDRDATRLSGALKLVELKRENAERERDAAKHELEAAQANITTLNGVIERLKRSVAVIETRRVNDTKPWLSGPSGADSSFTAARMWRKRAHEAESAALAAKNTADTLVDQYRKLKESPGDPLRHEVSRLRARLSAVQPMLAIIRRANGNGRDLREMAGELFEAFDAATAKTTHLGPDPEQEIAPTQPAPSAHDHGKPQTWLVVIQYAERAGLPEGFIADMRARHELGMKRYGTPLQPFNGRNSKLDLYEEMLDATAYAANCAIENFVGGALGAIAVDSTFHQVLFMAAGMRP